MTKSIVPIDSWLSSSAGKLGSGAAGYQKVANVLELTKREQLCSSIVKNLLSSLFLNNALLVKGKLRNI